MIDLVYRTVQVLLNKNGYGVITPDRFNSLAEAAQLTVYSTLANELRRVINRKKQGYSSITESQIRGAYDIFLVDTNINYDNTVGGYLKPSDCVSLDSVFIGEREAEIVAGNRFRAMRNHVDSMFPVSAEVGAYIYILPEDSSKSIDISYHRAPLTPCWTYIKVLYDDTTTTMEKMVFDATSDMYQDFELPESYFSKLTTEILEMLGLHLKESDVIQVAELEKQQQTKNEAI